MRLSHYVLGAAAALFMASPVGAQYDACTTDGQCSANGLGDTCCNDGSCKQDAGLCECELRNHALCKAEAPICCSDNICKSSLILCGCSNEDGIICAIPGNVCCADNTCKANLGDCVYTENAQCIASGLGGTCCEDGTCKQSADLCDAEPTAAPTVCAPGTIMCDDPHMQGLRGQTIDWSGVDGGWYCLVTDDNADIHINVRLTAPLPVEFPDRQLITGLSIASKGHWLGIEVTNPYNVDTSGCRHGVSPCLADGGLRAFVDGEEVNRLLRFSRHEYVADGIAVSASNLPVECRQFGGDKIWARMYDEMLQGQRQLAIDGTFEDWILSFGHMAAIDWCAEYMGKHNLADFQSKNAIFEIVTSAVTVRLNVGTNYQGNGELDWDGRVLPDIEFWQMDVGLHGLSVESETLSGILGETARPVLDNDGHEVMKGYEALRGTVEDYRVSGSLATDFALLHKD